MLQTLDIRPGTGLDVGVRDELAPVAADLARQLPDLPPSIVLPWSDDPVVTRDRSGAPWLYASASRDPLRRGDGVAVLPRRQRRQLRRIAAVGARFDAVAVAHELDPDGPARSVLPLLADGPRTCTDEVARALVGPVPQHPGLARVAGMLDQLRGGDALTRVSKALDRLLDPVVLGVVAPYGLVHGAPAVFQPLVAWRW
jgi:hypothetical protein